MPKRLVIVDAQRCVGCQMCMFACTRKYGYGGTGKSAILVRSVGGMEHGFSVIVCRACTEPACAKVCPTGALRNREGGGVSLDREKCIGCGFCAQACTFGAIFWDNETNKPEICIYCGYCVNYCPHGVLAMEERV
ncbi:MAG: 4Fe-4S binding protein [Thermoplasmata archaeon]